MRILAVSDVPSKLLWGSQVEDQLREVDLILSCGDLDREYLEYLVTFARAPLFYVPGNHDKSFRTEPPEGCECIDDRVVRYQGLRIAGLGGCVRYNQEDTYQYTQAQMDRRAARLWLSMRRYGGCDLLLTHAPAAGAGAGEDPAHAGFRAFDRIMARWSPRWLIHGHTHLDYDRKIPRSERFGRTEVINAFERYVLETGEDGI